MRYIFVRLPRYKTTKFLSLDNHSIGNEPGVGTPRNSWCGCAARVFKSRPYFRPKQAIFHTRFQTWPLKFKPVFRPELENIHPFSERKLTQGVKLSWNDIVYLFLFLAISWSFQLRTEKRNMFVSFRKCSRPQNPDPISDHNCQNLYPFSDQNGSKTIPFGAAHTYISYIGEYPPPPG